MIVALLALAFAMVGTAVAGVATISVLSQGEKKQVRKIAKREADRRITVRARKLSVNHATTADSVTNAVSPAGAAPLAYAAVNGDGTLTPGYAAKSIDEGDVTNPAEGAFCFELAFTPKTAAANPQAEPEEDGIMSIDLVSPFTACPAAAEAEVRNIDAVTGPQDDSFIVQFDG